MPERAVFDCWIRLMAGSKPIEEPHLAFITMVGGMFDLDLGQGIKLYIADRTLERVNKLKLNGKCHGEAVPLNLS